MYYDWHTCITSEHCRTRKNYKNSLLSCLSLGCSIVLVIEVSAVCEHSPAISFRCFRRFCCSQIGRKIKWNLKKHILPSLSTSTAYDSEVEDSWRVSLNRRSSGKSIATTPINDPFWVSAKDMVTLRPSPGSM